MNGDIRDDLTESGHGSFGKHERVGVEEEGNVSIGTDPGESGRKHTALILASGGKEEQKDIEGLKAVVPGARTAFARENDLSLIRQGKRSNRQYKKRKGNGPAQELKRVECLREWKPLPARADG